MFNVLLNLQNNAFNIYDCNMLAKITKTVSADSKLS